MKMFKFCPYCAGLLQTQNNRQVCAGATCGYVHYDNPLPVVAAIVELPEGVVLAHNRSWPAKVFSVPTGFVEHQENPQEAVVREVQEELGLAAQSTSLVGVYPFAQQNQIIIAYHMLANGTVVLGDELDEFKIVPVAKLRGWGFGTGLAVQAWLDAR